MSPTVGIDLGTPVVEAIGAEAKSRFTERRCSRNGGLRTIAGRG
jgi:hypothetical protein